MSKAGSVAARGDRALRRRAKHAAAIMMCTAVATFGVAATHAGAVPRGASARGASEQLRAPLSTPSASSLRKFAAARLGNPKGAASAGAFTAAGGSAVDPIELRVLVLATKGEPNPDGVHTVPGGSWDWDLSTLTSALDYAGVPYDVYKSVSKQLCQ